jgi:membrane protease YdiL (CAAX protease family)
MTSLEILSAMRFFSIADGVLLGLCLLVGLLLRWVLRRLEPPPASVGTPSWRSAAEGTGLAVGLLAATIVPAFVAGGYRQGPGWQAYPASGDPIGPALTWLFFAVQALLEELVFRGVAMTLVAAVLFVLVRLLLRRWGMDHPPGPLQWAWLWAGLAVNLLVSALFGLVHADNPNATPVAVLNVVLISLVLGLLVWTRASILGAWALHWVWNASIVTLGFPISGIRIAPPIDGFGVTGARDGLLTGGQFGPEGALSCTIALVLILCALVWQSLRNVLATIPTDGTSDGSVHRGPETPDSDESNAGSETGGTDAGGDTPSQGSSRRCADTAFDARLDSRAPR